MLFISFAMPDTLSGIDDLIRSGLEEFAAQWFWRLVVFTAIVLVGLLFEAPEIWHETASSLREIFRRPKEERKPAPWIKLAGTIGWLLIIIGVAGECIAEGFLFKADGLVVKFDEILLANTTKSAGNANVSAKGAAAAADLAKRRSDAAVSSASNALNTAAGARKEADSFEQDIVSAKQQAADAESHLADALRQAVPLQPN
jgi:hypothetical protein